jgi:hypothetical protein
MRSEPGFSEKKSVGCRSQRKPGDGRGVADLDGDDRIHA